MARAPWASVDLWFLGVGGGAIGTPQLGGTPDPQVGGVLCGGAGQGWLRTWVLLRVWSWHSQRPHGLPCPPPHPKGGLLTLTPFSSLDRGKCSVALLNETESVLSYLDKEVTPRPWAVPTPECTWQCPLSMTTPFPCWHLPKLPVPPQQGRIVCQGQCRFGWKGEHFWTL